MEKFMAFKFQARRHFGFYDVLRLPLLFESFQESLDGGLQISVVS